jgi:hypothetical protein
MFISLCSSSSVGETWKIHIQRYAAAARVRRDDSRQSRLLGVCCGEIIFVDAVLGLFVPDCRTLAELRIPLIACRAGRHALHLAKRIFLSFAAFYIKK